jgi:hypothetical protein
MASAVASHTFTIVYNLGKTIKSISYALKELHQTAQGNAL